MTPSDFGPLDSQKVRQRKIYISTLGIEFLFYEPQMYLAYDKIQILCGQLED